MVIIFHNITVLLYSFDQINAALMSIKGFQRIKKKRIDLKHLNNMHVITFHLIVTPLHSFRALTI